MKKVSLSPEFLRGVHHLKTFPQGVMLLRFPESVTGLYQDDAARITRIQAPAGVRILFETDARTVKLPHSFGRTAREIFAFSVFLDGEPALFTSENGVLAMTLPAGRHTVEILVPHLVECYFGDLELDDNAVITPAAPPENPGKLLFVGDSIMQGMTTSSPAQTYADMLARNLKIDFYNLAVGGFTADPAWAGLVAGEYEYSRVIFCLGCNDFCLDKSLADYRRDLEKVLSFFAGKPMVIFSMTPILCRPEINRHGETLDQFRACVRELAAARPDTLFVDGKELLPAEEKYFIDGLHPNDLGAETFYRNLRKFWR